MNGTNSVTTSNSYDSDLGLKELLKFLLQDILSLVM
jgi:hypothetical protein